MKNKKLLIIGSVIGILVIVGTIIIIISAQDEETYKLPDHEFEDWDAEISNRDKLTEEAFTLFDTADSQSFEQLMESARKGKISLVSELWRLRRNCPRDMSRYDCNTRIRLYLEEKFPPPGREKIVDIFMKYLKYEEVISEYAMPGSAGPQERYKMIMDKRREIFGEEDAKLVFGLEESKYDYSEKIKSFVKDTAMMSGDQRMQKYEEMRREVFGDYYDAMIAREPAFTKFNTELKLRENDFNVISDENVRQEALKDLRVKYFGRGGADRMAVVDRKIEQGNLKLSAYKKEEADFLVDNPNINDKEKEEKLMELRIRHLGKKEAEAYSRREKYRKYTESQKR